MAIEFPEDVQEETLTAGQAVALIREISGDLVFSDSIFQNLATAGEIEAVGQRAKSRLYARADVMRIAEERKAMRSLLSIRQVSERAAKRGITISEREVTRMAEDGRLPVHRRIGRRAFFHPDDADRAINGAAKNIKMAEQIKGLRNPRQSVAWINARLEEQGRDERVDLDRFYSWCREERKILEPDYKMPYGKRGTHRLFYFSEETLMQAPVFKAQVEIMGDRPEPVHVTNSKKLIELEQKYGELVIRDGIRQEGLSVHAVNRKDRKVHPVGYVGQIQWFPKKYIPEKLRRRRNRRDIIRDAIGDD